MGDDFALIIKLAEKPAIAASENRFGYHIAGRTKIRRKDGEPAMVCFNLGTVYKENQQLALEPYIKKD